MQLGIRQVRLAVRTLFRYPLVASIAVITIALGVGANTAIFSVINGVMLQPLPYPEASRLVMVWTSFPENPQMAISAAEYLDYRSESGSFASMGAFREAAVTVTGADSAERRRAAVATGTLFDALDVGPALGRTFTREELAPGGGDVVILDHAFWQSHFAANPDVLGDTLTIDDDTFEIVGVMPASFALPDVDVDFFLPLSLDRSAYTNRSGHNFTAVGRLAADASLDSATAELQTLLLRWKDQYAGLHANDPVDHPLILVPLEEQILGAVRPTMWALLGAVGLVLLLATANVANLLLARGHGRRREIAVRTALGARRRDLVGQLMLESLVLAGIGGLVGLALGAALMRIFRAVAPEGIPRIEQVGLDGNVLLFSTAVTIGAGLLFGVLPALQLSRGDARAALADGGRGGSAGRESGRTLRALVVAQIGLAVVLLVGSGVLIKSFVRLRGVDPGFETHERIGFRVQVMHERYPERAAKLAFYERLQERLAAVPGVRDVALARGLPLVGGIGTEGMAIEGREPEPDGRDPAFDFQIASPGYFELMGIPLVDGRPFRRSDRTDAPGVVLINEAAARAYFPGENPVGRRGRILFAPRDWPPVTIVGVVGDVRHRGLASAPRPEVYLPPQQVPPGWTRAIMQSLTVALRTEIPLERIAPEIRRAVREIDPTVPVDGLGSLDEAVSSNVAHERFNALLVGLFAVLALLIASVGVYGVMAFSVEQRTREFGIRMALGAEPRRVLGSVLRSTLTLVIAGGGLGLIVATLATRALASLVYEVGLRDPAVFATSAITLAVVALAAALIPARRAAAVEPMETLRSE